jgi:hypothetical protein
VPRGPDKAQRDPRSEILPVLELPPTWSATCGAGGSGCGRWMVARCARVAAWLEGYRERWDAGL